MSRSDRLHHLIYTRPGSCLPKLWGSFYAASTALPCQWGCAPTYPHGSRLRDATASLVLISEENRRAIRLPRDTTSKSRGLGLEGACISRCWKGDG